MEQALAAHLRRPSPKPTTTATPACAPLSKLIIGMECGGSDGFSGISANPAAGKVADILVALGGSVILSEFPERCAAWNRNRATAA